jgi:chromosome partitioning protein
MQIVSIWNPKGGQGKTMLAINLSAACTEIGIKPLLICQDPQGTALMYYENGNLPFTVINQIPQNKPDADIIFFDHQASDWEVPSSQTIIMPLKPARDQYATYIDAYKRAEKKSKRIFTVVTDSQQHRQSEKITTNFLRNKGAFVIPASGVFSRASDEYRTIFDAKLNKAYKINERRRDVSKILGSILIKTSNSDEALEVINE